MFNIANASEEVAQNPSGLSSFFPLIMIFAVFYLFIIRPQSKKQKEQNNMINDTKEGDEIVTSGGIFGKVIEVQKEYAIIEISTNNNIKILRHTIAKNTSFEDRKKQEVQKIINSKKK